jgi:hypothetical protein
LEQRGENAAVFDHGQRSVPMSPTPIRTVDPQQIFRTLRMVWAVMLISLGLYVVVLALIHDSSVIPPNRTFQLGIMLMGSVTGAVVLYLRFVRIAGLYARPEPMDAKTLALQANFNYILCFVFSETTALFGFALAFMHGDPKFYALLYLGGVLLMLLCFPRLPASESQ